MHTFNTKLRLRLKVTLMFELFFLLRDWRESNGKVRLHILINTDFFFRNTIRVRNFLNENY